MNIPIVLRSDEIAYNFNSKCQGSAPLELIDTEAKYPKHLLIKAWEWFVDFCKDYHIDPSYYKYATITKHDPIWIIDFYDTEDRRGAHFGLTNVYYNSKDKKILQAEIYFN